MKIKDICEKFGLSQTDLAKRFDIPLRTVQDWHAGRRNPQDYVISMMVKLLERDTENICNYTANRRNDGNIIPYNKLIRDRIPEIIESSGKRCEIRILEDEEYLRMIDAKLDEELAEYHKDQNIEELADLLEVIYAAAEARGYSIDQLEEARATKAEKRGRFQKKLLLIEVEEK